MCFTWNAHSQDRGGQGDPREASLKEERQKVREQRAFHGAAMEAAVWPHQLTDNNNSINNNNNGGYQALCSHFPGIISLTPHACGRDYHHSHFTDKNTEAWSITPRGLCFLFPSSLPTPCIWNLSVLPKPRLPGGSNSAPPSLGSLHPPCPPASLTPAGPPLELTLGTKHLHILLFIEHLA